MSTRNYGAVPTLAELERLADRIIQDGEPFGFDIETGYLGADHEKFALHPETAIVVGLSLTNSTDWARYAPLHHDVGENLDNAAAAAVLWPMLATGRGVAHNAPFEMRHLSRWFREHLSDHPEHGAAVRASNGYFTVLSDTQVESYIAAEYQSFGLKFLIRELFDHTMIELHELFEDLPKNRRKMLRFNVLDPADPRVVEYACEDSLWALALHLHYHPKVRERMLYRVEMGVLDCVCEMEDFGVRYDWGGMRRAADELRAFRDRFNGEIMTELGKMVGAPVAVNLASPAQVAQLLYGQLGFKTSVFTATSKDKPAHERKMSTGAVALAGLAKRQPVVKQILQWKEMTRLLGTYLDKYEDAYSYAADGRTHPNHLSAVVVTGRFAVGDPPYQQSPKKYHFDLTEAKDVHARHDADHGPQCTCDDEQYRPAAGTCFRFNFRDSITAPDDHYMLGFDLSQAELRVIAGEAQETALLRAFETGQDVHALTAALMLRIPLDQVQAMHRDVGKTMNFALLYGMSPQGLADRLGLELGEAQALYSKYFSAFSAIAVWAERQVAYAKAHGHVVSRFGRVLPIWEYQSDKAWIRSKGDRAAVNYPIQGGATGDYMKVAMVRARKALRQAGLHDRVHMIMNVHDALEFYVDRTVPPQDVIAVLQPAVIFPVPGWPAMRADWHVGKRWGSPVEVEYTDDGKLITKGGSRETDVASVEVDEETGEEMPELPAIDPAVLDTAAVPAATPTMTAPDEPLRYAPPSADGRRVIVTIEEMPDEPTYRRFLDLLIASPGVNTCVLRTPQGELAFDVGTSLTPGDAASVNLALGAATVTFDATDIDPHQVVAGLAF